MIAAGRCYDTRRRYFAHEQIRERASDFEGARVLKELELEGQTDLTEPEILTIDIDNRRSSNVRRNPRRRSQNAGSVDYAQGLSIALRYNGLSLSWSI